MSQRIVDWRTVFLVENQNCTRANIISLTDDSRLIYKRRLADLLNSGFNPTDNKFQILRNERYGIEEDKKGGKIIQAIKNNPQLQLKDILFGFEVDFEDLYVGNTQKKNQFRKKLNLHYELELQVGPFRIRGHTYNIEEKIRDLFFADKFLTIHNSEIVYSTQQGKPFLEFYRIYLDSNVEKNIICANSRHIDLNTIEIHNVKSINSNEHPLDLAQIRREEDTSWAIGESSEEEK